MKMDWIKSKIKLVALLSTKFKGVGKLKNAENKKELPNIKPNFS